MAEPTDRSTQHVAASITLAKEMIASFYYDHKIVVDPEEGKVAGVKISSTIDNFYKTVDEDISHIILDRNDFIHKCQPLEGSDFFDTMKTFANNNCPPGSAMAQMLSKLQDILIHKISFDYFFKNASGFDILSLWLCPPVGAKYECLEDSLLETLLQWLIRTKPFLGLLRGEEESESFKNSQIGFALHVLSRHSGCTKKHRDMCKQFMQSCWEVLSAGLEDNGDKAKLTMVTKNGGGVKKHRRNARVTNSSNLRISSARLSLPKFQKDTMIDGSGNVTDPEKYKTESDPRDVLRK